MNEKILVVDGNGEFRELLESFLSRRYEVKTAGNGIEALGMLKNGYMPDLIVSDNILSPVDGKSFLLQVKEDSRLSHIPAILITSIYKYVTRADLIRSGANDYLVKPFGLSELDLRIENLLKVTA
jgi:DNA-binding response OmpR family regulator